MNYIRRAWRKAIQIVANCRQFETRIGVQPVNELVRIVAIIAIGASTIVIPIRVQQEERWVEGIKELIAHDLVVQLPENAWILKCAKSAARVFVAKIPFGWNSDYSKFVAVGVFISNPGGAQQRRADWTGSPNILKVHPVVCRWILLIRQVRREHAFIFPPVRVTLTGSKSMN